MAGVNIVLVAYKSSPQAVEAMLGGDLQLIFAGGGTVAPFLKAGRLRALAVTGMRPSTLVPGLPTVAEAGVPGYAIEAIAPLLPPAKTPAAIIKRLNQEIVLILDKPEVKGRLLTGGIEVATSSPEELGAVPAAPASDNARLRHGAAVHAWGGLRRRGFMLTSLAGDGPPDFARAALVPTRPEERRVRRDALGKRGQVLLDIVLQELGHHLGQGNVACLAALDADVPQTPFGVEVLQAKRGHGFSPHPRVPQDEEDGEVTRALALLGLPG
jgi:hypothetical protein